MENGAEPVAATSTPSPEQVLAWIAASKETPWFPARHAEATGISRGSLDQPLNHLRSKGLVRVADWVRGLGQGYAVTPEGEAALNGKPAPPPPPEPIYHEPPQIYVQPPTVTRILAAANVLVYFAGVVIALRREIPLSQFLLDGDVLTLHRLGSVSGISLLNQEWRRLASCCFLHGNILHLLVNVVSLVMLGSVAEHVWGRWRMLIIYLVSGFTGSCLAMAMQPESSVVGASGAIYGTFLSLVAWLLLNRRFLVREALHELSRRLALVFLLSLAVNFLPQVSWQGHLGGAVGGFAAAVLVHWVGTSRGWRRALAVVLVASLPAASLTGLMLAMRYAPSWSHMRELRTIVVHPVPTVLLNSLRPEVIRPRIMEARILLMLTPHKRKPERVNEVRSQILGLASIADELVKQLENPAGDEWREKARNCADARLKSLSMLLMMIESNTIPTVEEWKSWSESNREADRLWDELKKTW